jgi:hypothetical protein
MAVEPGAPGVRRRVTVSILTRNSENRLDRLLREVSHFADEIIVGVDAMSSDATAEIAAAHADVVYYFLHAGKLAAARMLVFDYATGDWIFSLDDDESIEGPIAEILPELTANEAVTHYWFPRKWIVNEDPYEFLYAPPWFPDWQLRLFRNDRALVWKPARPHTGYHVQGPSHFESRASILHLEPIWCSPEDRARKVEGYRRAGAQGPWEAQFHYPAGVPRRPAEPPLDIPRRGEPARTNFVIPTEIRDATSNPPLPWRSEVIAVSMDSSARCGQYLVAEVTVRNTGTLAWTPSFGLRSASLSLGYHVLDASGSVVEWEGGRCPTMRHVAPGESVAYLTTLQAPAEPGSYAIEWDMICEGEIWFAECGATVLRSLLDVEL